MKRRLFHFSGSICPENVACGNKTFYPSLKTIRNHMATKTTNTDDQALAEKWVSKLKKHHF